MDEDHLREWERIVQQVTESSEKRIEKVNCMVENITRQSATVNDMALRMIGLCQEMIRKEDEKYGLMMDFLKEMRTTYDKHILTLVSSRDNALTALHESQNLNNRLVDKIVHSVGVDISNVGNTKI